MVNRLSKLGNFDKMFGGKVGGGGGTDESEKVDQLNKEILKDNKETKKQNEEILKINKRMELQLEDSNDKIYDMHVLLVNN